mgnify:CR=1 FL=1
MSDMLGLRHRLLTTGHDEFGLVLVDHRLQARESAFRLLARHARAYHIAPDELPEHDGITFRLRRARAKSEAVAKRNYDIRGGKFAELGNIVAAAGEQRQAQ